MVHFFLYFYNLFKKHRIIFIIILIGSFLLAGYFSSKLKLEEDITKMMPSDEKIDKLNFILKNSAFTSKIIVNISLSDTSTQPNPEHLIAFTDILVDILQNDQRFTGIKEVIYKIPEETIYEIYDTFYENLPVFLDENDYDEIDRLITETHIDSALKKNYRTLISPAGFILKKFIAKDPLGLTTLVLKKLKGMQFDDNYEIYDGHIITRDKKNLLVFIIPANPASETARNSVLLNHFDEVIDSLTNLQQETSALSVEYYGAPAVGVCNANRLKKDVTITVSIALVFLLVFISLFFRRKSIFFIILLPALFGGLASLALLYFFKTEVSIIALAMGSVLLGITIDYSLHIFTHFRRKGSVEATIKDLVVPIIMSSLTTASAFLCLLFVSSEALQDMGLFAAFSVISAAIFSLIVLPHMLRSKNGPAKGKPAKTDIGRWIEKFTSHSFDKNKYLITVIVIISIICAFTMQRVGFEGDMMKMNYVSEDLKRAEENLNRISSSTLKSVYLVSDGKTLNEALINNEKIISKLRDLKERNVIKKYVSVSSLMISDSLQDKRINRWKRYWTEKKKQLLKQHLTEYGKSNKFKESAFEGFIELLNKDFIRMDIHQFDRIKKLFLDDYITQTDEMSTVITLVKVKEKNREAVYSSFSVFDDLMAFDQLYLTSKFISILQLDFTLLVRLSSVLIFLLLVFAYGRIELGIIAFIPMLLSWLWTLGLMGLFGIKFNIFNIIISTFIFGLGIDYSIFILQGLLQEHKYGYKNLTSYKTSIFLSAITTVAGIGVLIFAEHPALRSIALLSIIGIVSVVVIAYTIEPILFRWLIYKGRKKRTVPVTFFIIIYASICYSYFFLGGVITVVIGLPVIRILPVSRKRRKLLFHTLVMYLSRSTIYLMFLVKKKIIKPASEDFSRPAVIISNHQSLIDIPLMLMFTPKLIVLTNDWVWNTPLMGRLIRFLDFYPISSGVENIIDKLAEKVNDGYSIHVFPEGTRSASTRIKRFHKGAFYIAEKLKLDILPMVIHGTGHYIVKGEYFGRKSRITVKFLDRIKPDDTAYGTNYSQRTKTIAKYFRNEFEKVKEEYKTVDYYKDLLIKKYIYKGPILEWYLKAKLRLENNYKLFNELVPEKADITDVGCGYGFLAYMLSFVSKNRKITGIDYDSEKISIAANCLSKSENIDFVCDDITKYPLKKSDVFILSDVLHYLPAAQQERLIERCIENLNKDGTIIIRDANKDLKRKHLGTVFTELFSTNFGFNKTKNKLEYMSEKDIHRTASKFNLHLEVIDNTRFTSNITYIIKN